MMTVVEILQNQQKTNNFVSNKLIDCTPSTRVTINSLCVYTFSVLHTACSFSFYGLSTVIPERTRDEII